MHQMQLTHVHQFVHQMWLAERVFTDSSFSLLHVSQPMMGYSGFFITCMFTWQKIPLNPRSVLNSPRTGVASLTPNPDIIVFMGRGRGVDPKDLKSASDKIFMVAPESANTLNI